VSSRVGRIWTTLTAKGDKDRRELTRKSYVIGLVVLFGTAYSQYSFGKIGPVLGILLVYGIPILATMLLWGRTIIRKSLDHMSSAAKFGLGFFGGFTALGMVLNIVLLYLILALDPVARSLLNRPNPVLNIPPEFAWIMVWASLLIVGPAEEYLFRGFVYGGLLSVFKGRHWLSLAFASSILFAAAHLYYALVYGVTSMIQFTDLVTFGMAMAITYYLSRGNILILALIHGAYDAAGFLSVAISSELGILLRLSLTVTGLLVGISLLVHRVRTRRTQSKQEVT
jgi:membrane protease YdiL (CAAX protease family)